jgi:uncharacterized protein YndB with AHSA1/START domain/DNA-binding transcriptional ArsR family regulator
VEDGAVFRALADPSRRFLLDRLFEHDGQTLGELCDALPGMTRFGVMKHLDALEAAGLVVTHKHGRNKHHYLNPVPLRLVLDRWLSKYAEPFVGTLVGLKHDLEATTMSTTTEAPVDAGPRHIYETYIRCTPEALWHALTDPSMTERYYFGSRVGSGWAVGDGVRYEGDGGVVLIEGTVLAVDPPRRLVHTFSATWDPATTPDPPTRVTYEITALGDTCKLTMVHDGFTSQTATFHAVAGGWPLIAAGLKTLLETGEPLVVGEGV